MAPGSSSSSDRDPSGPDPDGQKMRVQPGTTGAEMAAERHPQHDQPGQSSSNHSDHDRGPQHRPQANHDDYYSGLEVVEPGLEVPQSALPETVYAEHKAWGGGGGGGGGGGDGYPFPEAASPSNTPGSQPYSSASTKAQYLGGHNPFGPEAGREKEGREGRVCGLRRMVFWCVLAVAVFVVVAGVAVGVGVGVGVGLGTGGGGSDGSTSGQKPPLPSATATAVASPSTSIVCPMANRTAYTMETPSPSPSSPRKNFLVLCGRDYNSCCGAVDMVTVNTTTFEACLEQCAAQEGCTAVGWGNYYGTNTCWLKSAWGKPNWSGSWYAAVMVD